jgi:uncharacterized protein (TIGR02757 family)
MAGLKKEVEVLAGKIGHKRLILVYGEHPQTDLDYMCSTIKEIYPRDTHGYKFLIGSLPKRVSSAGTYKRYLMYLRWMVRCDNIDMGLWSSIDKRDLLMPLDTHTFNVSRNLGLLSRKSCDMRASIELTDTLKSFDINDPIKYDFALYRIGQEKIEIKG